MDVYCGRLDVMNRKSTVIILVAAITVLSGALGMSLTGTFSDQKIGVANVATGMMTGHLEIEARNADGELFAYRQTDNEVVDDGEQCILKMLFESQSIGAVTESGLFNATGANANGMLARNSFAAVTINSGDSITITWTFKVGNDP